MQFKLNVPERLAILSILPKENTFINIKIINEALSNIDFGDEEATELEVKQVGENVSFNKQKGDLEKPIEIGERAYSIICESLEKLDKEKKLSQLHFTIYKKFIENKKTTDKKE